MMNVRENNCIKMHVITHQISNIESKQSWNKLTQIKISINCIASNHPSNPFKIDVMEFNTLTGYASLHSICLG